MLKKGILWQERTDRSELAGIGMSRIMSNQALGRDFLCGWGDWKPNLLAGYLPKNKKKGLKSLNQKFVKLASSSGAP